MPTVQSNSQDAEMSFARGLFRGEFTAEDVFPYPGARAGSRDVLSMLLDALDRLAKEPEVLKIEEEKRIPAGILDKMRAIGLFGLVIPEEYGGLGLTNAEYIQVMSAVAKIDSSLTVTVGAHQSIGLKALLLFGTEAQKNRYLPLLAAGELIAAFGLTEPGAGSDARSLATRADRDGDSYVLNGSKIWITNGGLADLFTVFARTHHPELAEGKRDRITAFLVGRDTPGFSSGPEEKKLGLLGSSTTSLHFENVRVPSENVIGKPGEGFKIAMSVLNNGRLGLAGACALGSRKLVQEALDHATQRRQFGKSLSEFGLIQSKFANMAIELYAAESLVRVTAEALDRGDKDYAVETAICKVYSTEMEWRIVNECLQIAGGAGYMREYGYEKALRDSRIFTIWEGANEILRLFIGLSGLQAPGEELRQLSEAWKKPLREKLRSLGFFSDYGKRWLSRRVSFDENTLPVLPAALDREKRLLERLTATFALECERALVKNGRRIIENEFAVKRLSDIAIDLYAMACVLSRAARDLDGASATEAPPVVRAFFRKARRRVSENLRRMERNDDSLEEKIARDLVAAGMPVDSTFH